MANDYKELFNAVWDSVKAAAKDLATEQKVREYMEALVRDLADAKWTSVASSDPEVRRLAAVRLSHRQAQVEAEVIRLGLEASRASRLLALLESVGGVLLKILPSMLA